MIEFESDFMSVAPAIFEAEALAKVKNQHLLKDILRWAGVVVRPGYWGVI